MFACAANNFFLMLIHMNLSCTTQKYSVYCHRGIEEPKVFTFKKLEEENFDRFIFPEENYYNYQLPKCLVIDLIVNNLVKNVVDLERLIINQPEVD